jgi:hypothetical protein
LRAQVVWGDVDSLPVLAVNQFVIQVAQENEQGPPSVLLTLGHVAPPIVLGTPEQQREGVAAVEQLTVRPVARFSIPADRMMELARLLQNLPEQWAGGAERQP